jgi:hypothetical protein
MMTDERKFRITLILSAVLVFTILSYNMAEEFFFSEIGSYLKRRIYFERVISKKGIDLHEGKYWRKNGSSPGK